MKKNVKNLQFEKFLHFYINKIYPYDSNDVEIGDDSEYGDNDDEIKQHFNPAPQLMTLFLSFHLIIPVYRI